MAAHRYRGRLIELFPPHDPRTPWMFRLAMLRDDTLHEMDHIFVRDSEDFEKTWRQAYALRRMMAIIPEAKDLFAGAIGPWLHAHKDKVTPDVGEWIGKWTAQLEATMDFMKPLRNAFGGHNKPAEVVSGQGKEIKDAHIARMIEGVGGATVEGTIDTSNQGKTHFHRITGEFFLLAWPDILAPDEDGNAPSDELIDKRYRGRHKRLSEIVLESAETILVAGATFLEWFWRDLDIPATQT